MARASTPAKLPLDTCAKYMGLHPLHFNQVHLELDLHCDQILFQHEWQVSDHVSREEIARAIADSEAKIEEYLGYHLAPAWETDEWRATDRFFRPELVNTSNSDVRGYKQSVQAKWGYVISGGIEAKSVVEAGAAIVYSDADTDNYKETATVTVATTVTDPSEICVFYPSKAGSDEWEIRPIEVSIAAGVATITFKRELAVKPENFDLYDITDAGVDGTDDAEFLDTVDVYRRYNDPQTQATFLWEPLSGGCPCTGDGCSNCAYSTQTGCLVTRGDPRQSIVAYSPGSWDADNSVFTTESWAVARQPDIVRLYYYSGWRNKRLTYTNRMDPEWERVVAKMAAALLDRPPCDCSKGNWERWREDLTIYQGDEDSGKAFYNLPQGILDNPFGTRRGEVEAWRKVKTEMIARAVAL